MTGPTPIDQAALLGTEHGTRAAEEWLPKKGSNTLPFVLTVQQDWPRPMVHQLDDWSMDRTEWTTWAKEYEVAFTAAVETTIRHATQTAS